MHANYRNLNCKFNASFNSVNLLEYFFHVEHIFSMLLKFFAIKYVMCGFIELSAEFE